MIAIPVYLTGEPAEEIVEALPSVSEPIIERHEDFAMFAHRFGDRRPYRLDRDALDCRRSACGSSFDLATVGDYGRYDGWTANLGGEIRPTEIRARSQTTVPATDQPRREKTEDQDD